MSIFSRLFGRKKEQKAASFKNKSPVSHVPSTMQKFYDTEALLTKRQEYLEMKMATELQTAKQYGTQNKRLALQALRRRKQYEKQLLQIDGSLNTLQQQKLALENASMNAEVLKTLVTTSKALKTAQKGKIFLIHALFIIFRSGD
jgi:charged multivesicular body protein 4